ncbi:MAG TPA: DUF1800 domain-containing protein [Burkholderiaceae bacterium]
MSRPVISRFHTVAISILLSSLLAACGGGSGGGASTGATPPVSNQPSTPTGTTPPVTTPTVPAPTPETPAAPTEPAPPVVVPTATPTGAARFLAQATFGATAAEINAVNLNGYNGWLGDQFGKAPTARVAYMNEIKATLASGATLSQNNFFEAFWKQSVSSDDQLRQRVAFALSQIFVVSLTDGTVGDYPRGVASYYDMLGANAFGNFRTLLEQVTLHPMMGIYLTSLRNEKESGTRVPDQNYAREVMQLFTIGIYDLNADGTLKLVNGKPVESYNNDDIVGMSRVMTGWSWAGPDKSNNRFAGGNAFVDRDITPMQQYPNYHSTLEKKFLGVSISGATTGEADLKAALDRLFTHPNTAPFFSRQLIQRLVTSNPSPAYVGRVAAVFADNGMGTRGDMKAVIRAILLDPEARNDTVASTAMRLREPVLRYGNWMRTFNAKSTSGRFLIANTDDPLSSLGQTPMRSPSVFNFYRPGYVPSNTGIAQAGLVAPEFQITAETSVVGYLNTMRDVILNGTGSSRDVLPDYTAELALAGTPAALVDRVNLLLMANRMSATLRNKIVTAVGSITVPAATATNAAAVAAANKNRVALAIFLAMASPEYLVQK